MGNIHLPQPSSERAFLSFFYKTKVKIEKKNSKYIYMICFFWYNQNIFIQLQVSEKPELKKKYLKKIPPKNCLCSKQETSHTCFERTWRVFIYHRLFQQKSTINRQNKEPVLRERQKSWLEDVMGRLLFLASNLLLMHWRISCHFQDSVLPATSVACIANHFFFLYKEIILLECYWKYAFCFVSNLELSFFLLFT